VWLLANRGKDLVDLLVLESRQDQGEGKDDTPAPASGGYTFFDRKAWDRCGQWDDISAGDDDHEHESLHDGRDRQDEDNVDHSHHDDDRQPPGQAHTPDPHGTDII